MFQRLTLFIATAALVHVGHAQDLRILDLDDHRYRYIQRLQERGHLLSLHPTALPYTYGEIIDAVERADESGMSAVEQRWLRHLIDDRKDDIPEDHVKLYAEAGGGLRAPNSRRLDPLRPLDDNIQLYQRLYVKAAAARGRWVAQLGMYHDGFYDRDPDGIDTALRAQTRPENGFLGFHDDPVSIYVGRFANHWGVFDSEATMISQNPRAYDQINLRFGGSKYSFRSFFAELDAIAGDVFTGRAGDDSVQTDIKRRFLFAHRFDLRPNQNIALTIMESILISGQGTGFSLRYLNPFSAIGLENDNAPKNDENNALLGLMLWARHDQLTFHASVTMDDLDVLNLGDERTSIAGTFGLRRSFRSAPIDFGVTSTAVAARTYNTHQTEGQYVYLLRGLATQYNDFAHVSAEINWYAEDILAGLVVTPRIHLLKQGEQRITGDFPGSSPDVDTFLSGVVETTRRVSVDIELQPSRFWWAKLDAGINDVANYQHVDGQDDRRFSGIFSFGIRVPIRGSDSIDLPSE